MKRSKKIGSVINNLKILDSKCKDKRTYYKVVCIYCGREYWKICSNVSNETTKCKCQYRYNPHNFIDGRSKERIGNIYNLMKQRCLNPNNPQYKDYGARNIKICDEWLNDYQSFKKWAYENGYDDKAPRGKCTLDRINVDGNYEPENCRWVDTKTQANNRRKKSA